MEQRTKRILAWIGGAMSAISIFTGWSGASVWGWYQREVLHRRVAVSSVLTSGGFRTALMMIGVLILFALLVLIRRSPTRESSVQPGNHLRLPTPDLRIGESYVEPLPAWAGEPGNPRSIARVVVTNEGDAQALDVMAQARFIPEGDLVNLYDALRAGEGPGDLPTEPPQIDCRWTLAGHMKPSGKIRLNPTEHRDLDIALKYRMDPYAFAYDDRAHLQTADGRYRRNLLHPGSYRVAVTVSGANFASVQEKFRIVNEDVSEGFRIDPAGGQR